jgi:hypothetical protein
VAAPAIERTRGRIGGTCGETAKGADSKGRQEGGAEAVECTARASGLQLSRCDAEALMITVTV